MAVNLTSNAHNIIPTADSADNSLMRDVIGNKTDSFAGDSLYAVTSNIFSQGYKLAISSEVDCTAASPITVFTVTGDVTMKIFGVVKSSLTTAGAITAKLGVAGLPAQFIAEVADATGLAINEIWHDATPDATVEDFSQIEEWIISNGQDVILTTTGAVTGGTITFYAIWKALSLNGDVA